MGGFGGEHKTTALVSAVVTIAILALMTVSGGVGFVTKKDFTENISGVAITLDQAKADLALAKSEVASAVQNMPATITNQVNNSVAQSTTQWSTQLSAAINSVNAMVAQQESNKVALNNANSEINTLKSRIDTLEGDVADAEARIEELEDKIGDSSGSSGSGSSSDIDVDVKTMSNVMMATDNNTLIADFRVVLENDTVADIEDVVLNIMVETGITHAITSFTLTGAGTTWQGYGWGGQYKEFVNASWGLNVKALNKKTLYLRMTVIGEGIGGYYPVGVGYSVDAEVD